MTDKSVNQFVKEMQTAGFDFVFRATDGKVTIVGKCKDMVIEYERVATYSESIAKIKQILQSK